MKSLASKELRLKVRRANQRLHSLERSGYNYYAYDIAKHYIDNVLETKYYSVRGLSKFELRRLERSIDQFLESKSSTVRGQKAIEAARIKVFEEKGLKGTREQKVEFLRFLGQDGYKNLTETIGYDRTVFKEIIKNYNRFHDTDRIEKIMDSYMKNQTNYAQFIKDLRSRKKIYRWSNRK